MSVDTRVAAFIEYVVRPLSEDWRLIIEKVKELDFPITPQLIQNTAMALGLWHLAGEVIRAISYLGITWIICQTVQVVWPLR